jgi:signal transduction histidine kinase/ligand-binding sensor domain-containing protein
MHGDGHRLRYASGATLERCPPAQTLYRGNVLRFPVCRRPFSHRILPLAAAIAAIAAGACLAAALEPETPLAGYGRQSWSMESGLPQNTVQALAQTRDGYVWLGTEAGLARFDGIAFTVFDKTTGPALPGNDIRCLLATADGSLWIGTSEGLARWSGGTVTAWTTHEGLPGNAILSLSVDARGALLVTTESGVVGIEGGRVVPVALDKLESPPPGESPIFSAELADGSHAQATGSTVTLIESGKEVSLSVGRELPGNRVQALMADREGGLWIGTNAGLARVGGGRLEVLPAYDPLAAASVLALMEDREGDVWVGTETNGLDILRDQRFHTLDMRAGLSSDATTAVVEDHEGTLWVGTDGGGLNALSGSGGARSLKTLRVSDGLASNVILSLAAAPNGDLWVGTPDGLNRVREGMVETFTSADGLPDDFIRSLLADGDGSLWIGTRRGLVHWTNAATVEGPVHMETFTHANGLGSDLVGAMAHDANGDLWVATLNGLSRLRGRTVTNFTKADGLSSDVVTALLRENGLLLIGTEDHGWDVWDGAHFLPAAGSGPLKEETVRAILDDGRGHLWFATANGIARCDWNAVAGAAGCADWLTFGPADGLRSRETAANSHPSAWRSHDGLLWFATPKGLVEADPAHFPVNTLPAPVEMERFAVDDQSQPLHGAGSWTRVEAGRVHFEFDYAGLSFVAPLKVRYRYRLEGFDRAWTEAGARRAAYYTNIPPGKYTFRVQAANNDGVWNTAGASLSFQLEPHYYQTIWFYLALLAAAIAGVILLLRLRLHRAEREFRAVLGERSRIAREIHDTLAQGYVGISVQLEVLAELLRRNKLDEAAVQLKQTSAYVREGLADARQSIWALRTQDAGEATLPVKLRQMADAAAGDGLMSRCSVFGVFRALPAETERELLRVAQEAIHNVRRHAAASELRVQLEYGAETIVLEITDNGRGGALENEQPAGHFGMTGMRERAAAIGGTLEVESPPGKGTTVRLSVRLRAPAQETRKERGPKDQDRDSGPNEDGRETL